MTQTDQATDLLKRMSIMLPFVEAELRFEVLNFLDALEHTPVMQPTFSLLNAVEFLLREARCGHNKELREVFTFEEESEIHLVLTEAVEMVRLSLANAQPQAL